MKVMKNIPRLIMFAVLTLIAVVFVIPIFYSVFNQKEGLIPRSLLRNKLFQDMEEVIY
ncbi:hypothetical protein QMP26_01240 [Enterocloster clostridioformis]